MSKNLEARIARLEEAATGGERIQPRPITDAPAYLRQPQSFTQPLGMGRTILWLDDADIRS
jgi:hypothetical protein